MKNGMAEKDEHLKASAIPLASVSTSTSVSALPSISQPDRAVSNHKALSGSKAALLPDLSASTQEILARLEAESAANDKKETSPVVRNLSETVLAPNARILLASSSASDSTAQSQRHEMAVGIFDKSKLKSAFASALIPKSKALPSQPPKEPLSQPSALIPKSNALTPQPPTEPPSQPPALIPKAKALTPQPPKEPPSQPSALTTESGPTTSELSTTPKETEPPQSSTTKQANATTPSGNSDVSTITVMASSDKPAPSAPASGSAVAPTPQPSGEKGQTAKPRVKVNHTYVLPNGEIVTSGKGLGRGRPGIKRGPRKSKSTTNLSEPKVTESRKRKRSIADSDAEAGGEIRSPSVSASDSDDEYSPEATQTRSGRHTQRPTTFVPPESPSHKKPRLSSSAPTSNGKLPIKRKMYKGKEQSALCEHCSRGYGPLKNAIVFCDGCNRCWHQRCHNPTIPRKLVLDPSTEWFCYECAAIREKSKKTATGAKAGDAKGKGEKATTGVAGASSSAAAAAAETLRRDYLSSLSKESLVDLLMQASTLAPSLPIWKQVPADHHPPTTTNTATPKPGRSPAYPTPTHDLTDPEEPLDKASNKRNKAKQQQQQQYYDNEYDDFEDEHGKLYPRPGHGVQLPPESEDLDMLLEKGDSKTFSHTLREHVVAVGSGGGVGGGM